jgi:hypothetical protein
MLVNVHAGGAGGCGAMQYNVILRQSSRFSGVRLGGFCIRMAHYVAIAWGLNFWRAFLLRGTKQSGLGQLFGFCFYLKKPINPKSKRQCAACAPGTKSMTKI